MEEDDPVMGTHQPATCDKKKIIFLFFLSKQKENRNGFYFITIFMAFKVDCFFFFTGPVIFLFVLLSGIFLMVNACQLYIKKYIYKYKIITCLCVVGSKFMYGRWKKKYRKKWNHSRRPRRDTPPPQMNGWIY